VTTIATLVGEPLPVDLMNTVFADRAGVHDALGTPADVAGWFDAVGSRLADLELMSADEREDLVRRLLPLRDALLRLAAEATGDTRWITPDALGQAPAAQAPDLALDQAAVGDHLDVTSDQAAAAPHSNAALDHAAAGRRPNVSFDEAAGALRRNVSLDDAVAGVNATVLPRSPQLVWTGGHATTRQARVPSDPAAGVLSTFAEEAIVLFSAGEQSQLRVCEGPDCGLYFVKNHPRREWCSPACGNRVRAARHYRRHRKPAV
jgi:predicted RNA-binding Zn ribbon-like protein